MQIINNGFKSVDAHFVKILDNGKRLYELNGKYMTFYEDIPEVFTIADRTKDEFKYSTNDENKLDYAEKFEIWPELGTLESVKFDPALFKC